MNEKFFVAPNVEGLSNVSTTVKQYLEKRNLKDRVLQVPVYQGLRTSIGPAEKKILITEKLNGCMATIIWTEFSDHTRSAQLVHFPHFMLERHLQKITDLITESDLKAVRKFALVYLASKRKENESKIIAHMKNVLGPDLSVTTQYYEGKTDPESEILAVELRSEKDGNVVYHIGKDAIKIG